MKAIRAIRYEEKSRNTSKKLVHECIKDLEKEKPGEEGKWEKRKELLEKAGVNKEQLRNARETGDQNVMENLINKIKRNEKKEKQRKINKSRYNIYKDAMTEDLNI